MYATMRHPIVTASVANMMQAMSGDRFRLMFARAVPAYMKMLGAPGITMERSEEHTSELQSLMRISYAVFCLKKKNKSITTINRSNDSERMINQLDSTRP